MDSIFSLLFSAIGKWYIWLPIVIVLGFLAIRNNRRSKTLLNMEHKLLILEIPKTNDKNALAAEQMFASLHGILRSKRELATQGGLQEHISFEVASIGKRIQFYVWVPKHLQNFLEGQIYAQYPTVQIREAQEDYAARKLEQPVKYSAELRLTDNEVLPIKTFQSFEVDPLAAMTATLAKIEDPNEEMWIQIIVRPTSDEWHKKSAKYITAVKKGAKSIDGGDMFSSIGRYLVKLLGAFWQPPDQSSSSVEISERDKGRITAIEGKSNKLGYQVKIRLVYLGASQTSARLHMQAIVGTFKQYNSNNLNGFVQKRPEFGDEAVAKYRARFFIDKGYVLNIEEVASVFHLPHTNVETPNILWASAKTAEPPAKLPVITGGEGDEAISAFGLTNFRGNNQQFGLLRSDRGRHVYIIGQTGAGKSGLLELFALSDVFHNEGYAIIDPHGDFAIDNMRFIPKSRIKDVIYFNPSDTAFPMGFNPMEVTNPAMKSNISSEIIGVLKRMFGDSWGPRLEYILRYTILALLDYPDSTMLDITRMLTDKYFRKKVLEHVQDNVVLNFWKVEFANWTDKFKTEAISPVLNKVGAFTANPIIRNIIGQPKSTFNIRKIMDEGKILIVNLSKGLVGEDNAAILGAFLVIKIQLAAMSRSDIPKVEDRKPFYLYVDEFQNFATDSFATILSEARKYGLNLTVANQYISQMQESVRGAVFGNVGTTISFRVSADDSSILSKPFEPQFSAEDLIQMHNRHFIISMVINGEKAPAFSATTLTLPSSHHDFTEEIIDHSRHAYAAKREDVEGSINQSLRPPEPPRPKFESNPNNYKPNTPTSPQYNPQNGATATTRPTPQRQEEPQETEEDIQKRKAFFEKRYGKYKQIIEKDPNAFEKHKPDLKPKPQTTTEPDQKPEYKPYQKKPFNNNKKFNPNYKPYYKNKFNQQQGSVAQKPNTQNRPTIIKSEDTSPKPKHHGFEADVKLR